MEADYKKSMKEDKAVENQELVDGVEFALDWGLEVPEEDMREYIRITAYQQGRADEWQQALVRQLEERKEKIEKAKIRAVAAMAMISFALHAWITKDATVAIIFVPMAAYMMWKGE